MRRTRTLSDKLPSCPRLSLPVGLPDDAGCLSSVNDRFLNPHTDEVERKRLHGKKLQNAGGDCPVTPQVDRWDKLVCQTVYCAPYFWTVRCPQFGRWLDWMVAGCRVRLAGYLECLGVRDWLDLVLDAIRSGFGILVSDSAPGNLALA